MRVRRAAAQIVICFSKFVQEFVDTSARIFIVTAFFSFEIKKCPESCSFSCPGVQRGQRCTRPAELSELVRQEAPGASSGGRA